MRAPANLNALRALESAARHLSYVRAGQELHVTPAAVGHLVRGLEDTLGIPLFHRSPSGPSRLELSHAAQAALPDIQAGFDLLSGAVARLRSSLTRRTISVTVLPAFVDKWLLGRIERFQGAWPEYDLVVDPSSELIDFESERIDLGIRYGAGNWAGLASIQLMRETFFPVCSPSLMTGSNPPVSLEGLRSHCLIHDVSMPANPSFPSWPGWLSGTGQSEPQQQRGLQINGSASAIQAAIAGAGVAIGRTVLVRDDLASGRLVRPFGSSIDSGPAYHLVWKAGALLSAPALAFREWLVAECKADLALR